MSNIPLCSLPFFFLAEYGNLLYMSFLCVILFLGGWGISSSIYISASIFSIKTLIILSVFIFARAALPRYRFDQLLLFCWKVCLPFLGAFFMCVYAFLFLCIH